MVIDLDPCYYCGLPADSVDHVIPRALLDELADDPEALRKLISGRRLTVPSCRECNSLLGTRYEPTLAGRQAYIKKQLRKRYKKYLLVPDWSDDDFRELDDMMQIYVKQGIKMRSVIRARLAW